MLQTWEGLARAMSERWEGDIKPMSETWELVAAPMSETYGGDIKLMSGARRGGAIL